MSDRIDGPTPFYLRPIPGGARLEMDGLRRQVVEDVLSLLLDTDDVSFWDRLTELANPEEGATPDDMRLPYEELVSDLAERCSYRVPIYGRERLIELSRRLREIAAPKSLPGQQGRRAS
ncbi:hypothetical protein [Streptomyces marianii]|uniref:Uncharacterized protein n=1 Tax=Streptomyces marianii TaxID=1817406 RepID=A0A5R9E5B3_9ACTN|nr:hypothetical protein [Streptomyces marianii]TLQ43454.1 hypothetical protein FEF34_10125 [Streptomyces marianii]